MDELRISLIAIGIIVLIMLYLRGKSRARKEQSIFADDDDWQTVSSDPLNKARRRGRDKVGRGGKDDSKERTGETAESVPQQPYDGENNDVAGVQSREHPVKPSGLGDRNISRSADGSSSGPERIPTADQTSPIQRNVEPASFDTENAQNRGDEEKVAAARDRINITSRELTDQNEQRLPRQDQIPGFDTISAPTLADTPKVADDPVTDSQTHEKFEESRMSTLFVVINVVAKEGKMFSGKDLEHAFGNAGLKYGEDKAYHYKRLSTDPFDVKQNDSPMFSVLNMLNPGTFPHKHLDSFETIGIALVMQLPSAYNGSEMLRVMHNVALTLASDLKGVVCDDTRTPLTKLGFNKIRERVDKYVRQNNL